MESEPEPFASITRVVSRFGINRDKATILLIKNKWYKLFFKGLCSDYKRRKNRPSPLLGGFGNCRDEAKVHIGEYSAKIVENPMFDYKTTTCVCCWDEQIVCQNLGCGHYFCNRCVLDKITNKILHGNGDGEGDRGYLHLECLFYLCPMFVSHDFIQGRLTEEEYKMALTKSYQAAPRLVLRKDVVNKGRGASAFILIPLIVAAAAVAWRYKTR